jgi:MoxR-like ATPase
MLKSQKPVTRPEHIIEMQQLVSTIRASDALIDYVQQLTQWTRSGPYHQGLSPRAGLALLRSGRAWALLDGRDFVLPEDIQAVLPGLVAHRLHRQDNPDISARDLANEIINEVAIP